MSWISIDDVVGAHPCTSYRTASLSGPVNLTAPEPVTNRDFTRILGRVLSRPAVLPVPAPALRLALGEMADADPAGQRPGAAPTVCSDRGISSPHPDLDTALRHVLPARRSR